MPNTNEFEDHLSNSGDRLLDSQFKENEASESWSFLLKERISIIL